MLFCKIFASTVGISARTRRRSVGLQRDLIRWIQDFERNPRRPRLPILVKVSLVETLFLSAAVVLGRIGVYFELGRDFSDPLRCRGLAFEVGYIVYFYSSVQAVSDCWVPSGLTVDPYRLFGVGLCRGHVTSLIELNRDTLHTRLDSSHECHSKDRRCAFTLVSCMPSHLGGTGVFTVPGTGMFTIFIPAFITTLLPSVDLVGGPMMLRAAPTEDNLFLQYSYRFVYKENSFVYGGFVGVPEERVIRGMTEDRSHPSGTGCLAVSRNTVPRGPVSPTRDRSLRVKTLRTKLNFQDSNFLGRNTFYDPPQSVEKLGTHTITQTSQFAQIQTGAKSTWVPNVREDVITRGGATDAATSSGEDMLKVKLAW
uniref:Uncharacterized protein n=1 Tax=Ananas comosus var. bracteatus TaxID=296719 RepID=A0A6V7NWU1_ANACO|nr:unnamed protein product [Ananas comosus var. bracteatus]